MYRPRLAISSGHGSMAQLKQKYLWQSNATSPGKKPKSEVSTVTALERRSLTRVARPCESQTYKRNASSFLSSANQSRSRSLPQPCVLSPRTARTQHSRKPTLFNPEQKNWLVRKDQPVFLYHTDISTFARPSPHQSKILAFLIRLCFALE